MVRLVLHLLALLLLLHVIISGLLRLRVLLLLAKLSQVVLLLLAVGLFHGRVPVADVMRWRTTRLVLLRMVAGGHTRSHRDTVRGLHGNAGLGLAGDSWVHAAVGLRVVRGHAALLGVLLLLLLGLSLGSGILLLLLGLGNGGAVTALTRGHHHVLLDARVLLLHLGWVLLHRVAGHVLAVTRRGDTGEGRGEVQG